MSKSKEDRVFLIPYFFQKKTSLVKNLHDLRNTNDVKGKDNPKKEDNIKNYETYYRSARVQVKTISK